MDTKKVEEKVENKSPLKVEDKKLSKEELEATIGGGTASWNTNEPINVHFFFEENGTTTWMGGG